MVAALSTMKRNMIAAYQRHATLSAADIGALMDKETWLSADEAKADGWCDTILTEGDQAMAACLDLSRFKNVPQQIAARFAPGAKAEGIQSIPETERDRLHLRVEFLKRLAE
jgi:hypothetical protein